MTLQLKKSGNFTYLYALKSFRKEDGKCTTKVAEMTALEKEENKKVVVEYDSKAYIQSGEQRSYNGGYLFPKWFRQVRNASLARILPDLSLATL